MKRVFVSLMDSFGIGASRDAEKFGDVGSDTLGHIAENAELQLPNLTRYGLHKAALASTGKRHAGFDFSIPVEGAYGYAVEQSYGKDTPSGHWEIAGVPVFFDWGYFPPDYPSFPEELLSQFIARTGIPGVIGNCHASGTEIIARLGDEHVETGKPIVYTSADSVFQIAAHEEHFGLEKLYEISLVARELVDEYNIGRVIARPFTGASGAYERTGNRRDYSTLPPAPTLLDKYKQAGKQVVAIGKVADIYAHQGITQTIKADGNQALFDATLKAAADVQQDAIIFTNFVDFDSKYGHRRNIKGYADALNEFDKRLPELEAVLQEGDLILIAADHGCDPTMPGSDHTREHIPVLAFGKNIKSTNLGRRESFADIGQTIAEYLGIESLDYGVSFALDLQRI